MRAMQHEQGRGRIVGRLALFKLETTQSGHSEEVLWEGPRNHSTQEVPHNSSQEVPPEVPHNSRGPSRGTCEIEFSCSMSLCLPLYVCIVARHDID